jgi:diguanylate cyclase (GGDEF)-like protein
MDPEEVCPIGEQSCPVLKQIKRLKEKCEELRELSHTDALTGYFNLRHFLSALEVEMERTRRTALSTGLIMMDLDYFKRINDTYGHEAGNTVLRWATDLLRQRIRRIDIPCRYGGEEFAFILPGTPSIQARLTAERLRRALANNTLVLKNKRISLTASFGVGVYAGEQGLSVDSMIEKADRYLLEAKTNGRNCVCSEEGLTAAASTEITEEERTVLYTPPNSSEDEDGNR